MPNATVKIIITTDSRLLAGAFAAGVLMKTKAAEAAQEQRHKFNFQMQQRHKFRSFI
jgi:hypothetical protein